MYHIRALLIFAVCTQACAYDGAEQDQRLRQYLELKFPAIIEDVSADATAITIRGSISDSLEESWSLCEIRPHENITEMKFFSRALPLKLSQHKIEACIQRFDGAYDRIYSRWAIVEMSGSGPHLASHAAYAMDLSAAAKWEVLPRKPANKKGLNGIHPDMKLLPDLVELGVGNIVVNINLGSLVSFNNETLEY